MIIKFEVTPNYEINELITAYPIYKTNNLRIIKINSNKVIIKTIKVNFKLIRGCKLISFKDEIFVVGV